MRLAPPRARLGEAAFCDGGTPTSAGGGELFAGRLVVQDGVADVVQRVGGGVDRPGGSVLDLRRGAPHAVGGVVVRRGGVVRLRIRQDRATGSPLSERMPTERVRGQRVVESLEQLEGRPPRVIVGLANGPIRVLDGPRVLDFAPLTLDAFYLIRVGIRGQG